MRDGATRLTKVISFRLRLLTHWLLPRPFAFLICGRGRFSFPDRKQWTWRQQQTTSESGLFQNGRKVFKQKLHGKASPQSHFPFSLMEFSLKVLLLFSLSSFSMAIRCYIGRDNNVQEVGKRMH